MSDRESRTFAGGTGARPGGCGDGMPNSNVRALAHRHAGARGRYAAGNTLRSASRTLSLDPVPTGASWRKTPFGREALAAREAHWDVYTRRPWLDVLQRLGPDDAGCVDADGAGRDASVRANRPWAPVRDCATSTDVGLPSQSDCRRSFCIEPDAVRCPIQCSASRPGYRARDSANVDGNMARNHASCSVRSPSSSLAISTADARASRPSGRRARRSSSSRTSSTRPR